MTQEAERRYPSGMALHSRIFVDRAAAGVALARELQRWALRPPLLVLGLPRGGVPVAYEVARTLRAPLDVMLVRKIGMPGQPELAIGAIASGGVVVHEPRLEKEFPDLARLFGRLAEEQRLEPERRERVYRAGLPPPQIKGKTVVLVDDGLATGATMRAAVAALRALDPAEIVVAVPVAAVDSCDEFRHEVDSCICAATPEPLYGVGLWYRDFAPTSDSEVRELLALVPQEARP